MPLPFESHRWRPDTVASDYRATLLIRIRPPVEAGRRQCLPGCAVGFCKGRSAATAVFGYNREPFLFKAYLPVRLSELLPGNTAVVRGVEDVGSADPIARRLRDLGFVAGEPVKLVTRGPVGGDPLLVQIGFTRFALRRSEAARVWLQSAGATP